MDSYREHPSDFDLGVASETGPADDIATAIGSDERRMHVRAYNHWASLLGGRDFPSIEDLEPGQVEDFASHSILLDFTCGGDNPAIPYIGADIREECGLDENARTINDVPSRSLLSRLTDHYLQIIANRAPIGFEAEFANQRDETICYRGILMPFSSDGDTIDFIYGVINWKTVADTLVAPSPPPAAARIAHSTPIAPETPLAAHFAMSADEDSAEHRVWEDGPLADAPGDAFPDAPADEADDGLDELELGPDAGLADVLWAARETAEAAKAGEGRSRAALYQALSLAYDFAVAAKANSDDYAELLEESGVKAQARAPMTPVVKLVFGVDYDKARLTEFAAALAFAERTAVPSGGFKPLIEGQPGGLKGLVAAEREARRSGAVAEDRGEIARAALRKAAPVDFAELRGDSEFAIVLARRTVGGRLEALGIVDEPSLLDRAIRRAAR